MVYYNATEVEDELILLSNTYSTLSKTIELPNKSIEQRTIHTIIIGKDKDDKSKKSILFTGGVHAREWGGSDICIYFAADILEAYELNKGLRYGNKYFDAKKIKKIVDEINLIILPDVNPDGKEYSQSDPSKILWRGNRNLENPSCFGVDLNRNFDFLWDYKKYFSSDALVNTSDDPCDEQQRYRGKAPFSEPETQNVKWLFDNYPGIRHYFDIHCHGGYILHSWGIDQNQSSDPDMNFTNSKYNDVRGIDSDDKYKEYIPQKEKEYVEFLSNICYESVKNVYNKKYKVQQAFDLYATSGASDDYAYGRNMYNGQSKIYGFTIEFGKGIDDFQPPWNIMEKIIIEVSSGILAVCNSIIESSII